MELKKLENSSVELTLTLGAADVEEAYSKSLKDYAKKLTLKGFRQGKAPVSLVESRYGAAIREEVTFKLMEENLEKSYKDMDVKQRPLPYCTPVLQNEEKLLPFKPDTDITYSVVYDVLPEVKLPAYTGLTVEAETEKITDEQVNDEIERLRQQNALIIAKNGPIEPGDIVTIDYAELDADGKDVENTKRDDFTFTVGSSYNFYKLDKDIEGMKKGDSSVIEKTYGDDSGMGTDYLGKTVRIRVEIKDVKFREVPDLDDDFAQDVKDEYKTVADLKKATRKQLEERAEQANRDYRLNAILGRLADETEISLPVSMVNTQLEQDWRNFVQRFGMKEEEVERLMSANGSTKEQFLDTRRADCIRSLKLQLILEQVKEEQKFEVTDAELEEELKNYGEDIKKEDPNYEVVKTYAEDDIRFRKARNFLLENNKFTEPAEKKEASGKKETAGKKASEKAGKAEKA